MGEEPAHSRYAQHITEVDMFAFLPSSLTRTFHLSQGRRAWCRLEGGTQGLHGRKGWGEWHRDLAPQPDNGLAASSPCTSQTYKHAVFNPGPQLNLVLGPNGRLGMIDYGGGQ